MDITAANDAQPIKPLVSGKVIVAIVAFVVFTVFITWRARVLEITLLGESEEPALLSHPAPDFSARTLDGRTVSLTDFRGQKNVVVSFWASWCGPCRLEMPGLIKFYRDNHTASSDFELLAVSIDEDSKEAADFATAEQINFPVLLDPAQKMATAFQVDGIPTMFVIDKNGKITYGRVGYDMAMEYELAHALGIKLKTSTEGAADGNAGH